MTEHIKFPRIYHLPFSEGLSSDDKMVDDISCFNRKLLLITTKMDGENATLYRDGYHARSLDSRHHESRSWLKAFHSTIKHQIPEGWRICGENLYAQHSIKYDDLESYFQVFSVWDENNICLPIFETKDFCDKLGLTHVDILGIHHMQTSVTYKVDEWHWIEECFKEMVKQGQEGIVIRNAERFHFSQFNQNVAKAVRKGHVQTDTHWMSQKVIPNQLGVVCEENFG